MTQDFFLGQLRLIAVALIAFSTGKGWLSAADSSLAGAILPPIGLLLGPWLWSIYSNINKKLVPHNSVAIQHTDGSKPDLKVGDFTNTITKVVGCLLFAVTLFAQVSPAFAQTGKFRSPSGNVLTGDPIKDFNLSPKSAAPTEGVDATFAKFSADVSKLEKKIVDAAIVDVQAALDDANKHNDQISAPCWQANLDLLKGFPTQWDNPPTDIGIALGIQIQRDILNAVTGTDAKSLKVACAALWGDQLRIVANLGALIGIRIASGGAL